MIVALIAAVDESGGIGFQGRIPWRLSTDLRRFKSLTMGHTLVMGRKTCESIGRALPGRTSIVISRDSDFTREGYQSAVSLLVALEIAQQAGESEVFVIGGGEIFNQALPLADMFYLTKVHTRQEADTYFPAWDENEWVVLERHEIPVGNRDAYPSTFLKLERAVSPTSRES